jgi:hypothetical protein
MVDFKPKSNKLPKTTAPQNSTVSALPNHSDALSIEYLQRTIGNQATINLIQRGMLDVAGNQVTMTAKNHKEIQLGRKRRRRRRRKKNNNRGNQSNNTPEVAETPKETWSDWFWSWTPSYNAPENDDDDDVEIEDDPNFEREGGGSIAEVEGSQAWTRDRSGGDLEDMDHPEEEDGAFENPFAIEKLEIDLGEADFSAEGTSVGDVKGKGKSSISGDGTQSYSGKVTAEGEMGSGEASGKIESNSQELKGEGKASFLLGASQETQLGTLGWGSGGNNSVLGSGKMETKVGISSDMAAKIAYNLEKMEGEASGKLGAFFGAATETTVDVKLKANGKDLATTEGKIGISYGVGGEITGFVKWDSGTLSFGNQGKLSAGLGFSYGYSVSIDTNAIASATAGAAKSGMSWLWSWAWGS